jgi:hypothetical protein
MTFYESPYYQQEVADLEYLQSQVHESFYLMHLHPDKKSYKEEFLHGLYAQVEKEQCLITRLQLDGSEEAQNIIADLEEQAREAGMAPHHSLPTYHIELKNNIKMELKELTGEDLDLEVDID